MLLFNLMQAVNEGVKEAAAQGNELALSMLDQVQENEKWLELQPIESELKQVNYLLSCTKHSKKVAALSKRKAALIIQRAESLSHLKQRGSYEKVC
ncbi:hypothetical protein [Bacillus sp. FJAT-52991]|uniref:Uncharacterized protein n=1 Tax=Bacillus kandeliae TaxID=3129297 RepID=A0ABZ2NB73_9BACI